MPGSRVHRWLTPSNCYSVSAYSKRLDPVGRLSIHEHRARWMAASALRILERLDRHHKHFLFRL
jgi:hypothetical protein